MTYDYVEFAYAPHSIFTVLTTNTHIDTYVCTQACTHTCTHTLTHTCSHTNQHAHNIPKLKNVWYASNLSRAATNAYVYIYNKYANIHACLFSYVCRRVICVMVMACGTVLVSMMTAAATEFLNLQNEEHVLFVQSQVFAFRLCVTTCRVYVVRVNRVRYGVATISRLLKITVLFCRI